MTEPTRTGRITADLYVGKSTLLKSFLLVGIAVISTVFIWYSISVIERLKADTRSQVEKYVKLWQLAAESPTSGTEEMQFIFDEIIVKATFPIIVVDDKREPLHWRNIPGISPSDSSEKTMSRLRRMVQRLRDDDREFPIRFGKSSVNYLYYDDSEVIIQLKYMPYIEIGIVVAFLIVGMIGFQNIRRSEERYIWVGMAKEAAHQLGTPLSALLGWLEVIGSGEKENDPRERARLIENTVEHMRLDVERLQQVANRFGQIGSIPDLSPHDVNQIVQKAAEYYRVRLPFEGKGIQIAVNSGDCPLVMLNDELFGWALENLLRNGLQAIDSKHGRLQVRTTADSDGRSVRIEIEDNGSGISAPAARKIFRPGFTTKKRGWGMGLTLVKRIIEEYHAGKVTLKRSRPGETVFEIQLPVSGKRKD